MWSILLNQKEVFDTCMGLFSKHGEIPKSLARSNSALFKSQTEGVPDFLFIDPQQPERERNDQLLNFFRVGTPQFIVSLQVLNYTQIPKEFLLEFSETKFHCIPQICRRLVGPNDFGGGPLLYQDLVLSSEVQSLLRKFFSGQSLSPAPEVSDTLTASNTRTRATLRVLSSMEPPLSNDLVEWVFVHLYSQTWDPLIGDLHLMGQRYGFLTGSLNLIVLEKSDQKTTLERAFTKINSDPGFFAKLIKAAHLLPKSSPPASL